LLLVGASLFTRSLANLYATNPGFQTQSLVQFEVDVDSIGYHIDALTTFTVVWNLA
jgi:hypothetical protein